MWNRSYPRLAIGSTSKNMITPNSVLSHTETCRIPIFKFKLLPILQTGKPHHSLQVLFSRPDSPEISLVQIASLHSVSPEKDFSESALWDAKAVNSPNKLRCMYENRFTVKNCMEQTAISHTLVFSVS